jgi:hypothetical protein
MANKSRGTWYVSFDRPWAKRRHPRATETFPNEREAKKFARAKLTEAQMSVRARLILICRNGRLPQRIFLNGSKNRKKTIWLEQAGSYHVRDASSGGTYNGVDLCRHQQGSRRSRPPQGLCQRESSRKMVPGKRSRGRRGANPCGCVSTA